MIEQTEEWFNERIEKLHSIKDWEGEFKFEDGNGNSIILPEEHRKGFIIGVKIAAEIMGVPA